MTRYRYALSLTSQFPFCSIPFRLDSYSRCQFSCRYCFAAARGGFTGEPKVQLADPVALERHLTNVASDEPRSVVEELLAARVPLHYGGMSDPFMPLEGKIGTTLKLLRLLNAAEYPTIISTKSDLCAKEPYLGLLASKQFLVQMSLSTTDDPLGSAMDTGAPSPSRRLAAIEQLSRAGVKVACRIQPVLPSHENHADRVIESIANAGAQHVSVEHLKFPIEKGASTVRRLNAALGRDIGADYRAAGATRVGREWVLPAIARLERVLFLRDSAWRRGLTFGAADNDFLPLSDGESCCSGADLFGLGKGYRFNFTQAVRSAIDGRVLFSNISDEWRPERSIRQFVNSRSRLDAFSVEEYLRARWNGSKHGPSPAMFYGVEATDEYDELGFVVYEVSEEVLSLMSGSVRSRHSIRAAALG